MFCVLKSEKEKKNYDVFIEVSSFLEFKKKMHLCHTSSVGVLFQSEELEKECLCYYSFFQFYNSVKKELDVKIDCFNRSICDDIPILNDLVSYFQVLNEGGKLIRGVLVALGYYLFSEDYSYSLDLSAAFEVFQTSVLIHDDIIDKSSRRRGKLTMHAKIKDMYKICDDVHFSNSLALCVGDLGFYWANRHLIEHYGDSSSFSRVFGYFNDVIIQTIRGEILDVALPVYQRYQLSDSCNLEDSILKIFELKTAYYTMIGPLVLGMLLSSASQDKVDDIVAFAKPLGIAFQIQDDILGIYGDEVRIGKTVGSDIAEFKQTLLYSYIVEKRPDYLDFLLQYYGKEDLNEHDILSVQQIFSESGAKDYAILKMNMLFLESRERLLQMDWLSDDKKDILLGFILYLERREK